MASPITSPKAVSNILKNNSKTTSKITTRLISSVISPKYESKIIQNDCIAVSDIRERSTQEDEFSIIELDNGLTAYAVYDEHWGGLYSKHWVIDGFFYKIINQHDEKLSKPFCI